MGKWVEIEESKWEQKSMDGKRKEVNAYYHLDEIKIVEILYNGFIEISSKVVLITESNYNANQFMAVNYGIEIEFGN
jgi:hypothetical protein